MIFMLSSMIFSMPTTMHKTLAANILWWIQENFMEIFTQLILKIVPIGF